MISSCSHSGLVEEAQQFYHEFDDYYNSLLNELERLNVNCDKININTNNIDCKKLKMLQICHSNAHCALIDACSRKGLLDKAWKLCLVKQVFWHY